MIFLRAIPFLKFTFHSQVSNYLRQLAKYQNQLSACYLIFYQGYTYKSMKGLVIKILNIFLAFETYRLLTVNFSLLVVSKIKFPFICARKA